MDATVTWKNGLSFSGKTDSGFVIPLGASVEAGGADDGARPLELLLVGLGGCTGMDVISILEKKRQAVTGFDILLHADRAADHPKIFTDIVIEFVVTGKSLDPAAVERAVNLSATKYCSAMAMLSKAVNITQKITIREG